MIKYCCAPYSADEVIEAVGEIRFLNSLSIPPNEYMSLTDLIRISKEKEMLRHVFKDDYEYIVGGRA